MFSIEMTNGVLHYSENAIANIVGISVAETPGVSGVIPKTMLEGFLKAVQKDKYATGINVEENSGMADISIAISVTYGANIPNIANNIIDNVKNNVEMLTGVKVKHITVKIQDVKADDIL